MRIAVLGSGAVGGYYGAMLARAGHEVVFIARGAHRDAIRASGLLVRSPVGDWTTRAQAEDDTSRVGPCDLVLLGTPIDLRRSLTLRHRVARVQYSLEEVEAGSLEDVLAGL